MERSAAPIGKTKSDYRGMERHTTASEVGLCSTGPTGPDPQHLWYYTSTYRHAAPRTRALAGVKFATCNGKIVVGVVYRPGWAL